MADRLRILIVEDDDILSANLFTAIEDRNCSVVGPVATVADALALLGGRVSTARCSTPACPIAT